MKTLLYEELKPFVKDPNFDYLVSQTKAKTGTFGGGSYNKSGSMVASYCGKQVAR